MAEKSPYCLEIFEVYEDDLILGCDLLSNHTGLHYDENSNVSWKFGRP